jgi:uncharacterized membrane protein (GlpM family)
LFHKLSYYQGCSYISEIDTVVSVPDSLFLETIAPLIWLIGSNAIRFLDGNMEKTTLVGGWSVALGYGLEFITALFFVCTYLDYPTGLTSSVIIFQLCNLRVFIVVTIGFPNNKSRFKLLYKVPAHTIPRLSPILLYSE